MSDISYWNYRIIRYREGGFGIHEVTYDKYGEPLGRTERAVGFVGDDVDDLIAGLDLARSDALTRPVLDDPWPDDEVVDVEGLEPPATDES